MTVNVGRTLPGAPGRWRVCAAALAPGPAAGAPLGAAPGRQRPLGAAGAQRGSPGPSLQPAFVPPEGFAHQVWI